MGQCRLGEHGHNKNLKSADNVKLHLQGFRNRNKSLKAAENSVHVRSLTHQQNLPHT